MATESLTHTLPTHDMNKIPLPGWVLSKLPIGTLSVDRWCWYGSPIYYYAINKDGQRLSLTAENVKHNHSFPSGRPTHDINGNPLESHIAKMCPDNSYNIRVSRDCTVSYNIRNHRSECFAFRKYTDENGNVTFVRGDTTVIL